MSLWARINPFRRPKSADDYEIVICQLEKDIAVKRLALAVVVGVLSSIVAQAEFHTYKDGKRIKQMNYYRLNIEPNKNTSATIFWRDVIAALVMSNEALVVNDTEGFLLADSFVRSEKALIQNYYTHIESKGMPLFNRAEDEVFYFRLHNQPMKEIIDALYNDYGLLLEYSKKHYKTSNAPRGVLKLDTMVSQAAPVKEHFESLLNEDIKKFYDAEGGAVLPLTKGIEFEDLTNRTYKNASDSRDIRSLVDDVFDFVAIAFGISPQLLKGSVAESDKAWDYTLIGAAKPMIQMFENEINRKLYTYEEWAKNNKVKIDTSKVKVTSIRDLALAMDILTRNMVNTLDDNLEMLGREPVGGDEGATRFVTNNLSTLDEKKERSNETEN